MWRDRFWLWTEYEIFRKPKDQFRSNNFTRANVTVTRRRRLGLKGEQKKGQLARHLLELHHVFCRGFSFLKALFLGMM
jgi:hypothetical protein